MTTEEKAKAYDDALKRAKAMHDVNYTDSYTKANLETIFPQLKESEDERIIKTLQEYVKSRNWNLGGPTQDEVLAWLEKQKEPKPEHFELKAGKWYICHRAFCGRADHLTVQEGERFMCEKDGVIKGFVIKEPEKYFIECSAPALMEDDQKEQKPAGWSEDDEHKMTDAINFLESAKILYVDSSEIDKTIAWFKSLRPQPKQEWSEKHIADVFEKVGLAKIVREQGNAALTNAVQSTMIELSKVGNAEWSEEDKSFYDSIMCEVIKEGMHPTPEQARWLKSLPERFSLQSKQEWSDEDEEALKRAIECVRSWEIDYCDSDNRISERLKSFFERFNLQPKVEWSEEDSLTIADLINYFEGDSLECSTEEMVKRIKSLRPQYHGDVTMTEAYKMGFKAGKAYSWKPSGQEKGALRTAISILTEERNFPRAAAHLQAILDAFEDKESRKDWKPSKEQMEALDTMNCCGELSYQGQQQLLIDLYKQLKKLM